MVIEILYKIDSNNYSKNILNNVVYPSVRFVWSSVFGEVNRHKAWRTVDTFYINNKVKEVSFKIMHIIYPVKHLLECFKLEMDYSCDFCKYIYFFTLYIYIYIYIYINILD